MKLFNATVLFLLLLIGKTASAQEVQMPSEIKIGLLDNGLTYYLIPKGDPGKVKVSFISKIGAYAEKPEQHGYAHMVEHLLFKGSENYPAQSCMEEMRLMGMRQGKDSNGYTGKMDTEYFMTIPENDKKYFVRSMRILKDWMFYLTIDESTLEIEKKVIIEEITRAGGDPEGSPNLIGTQLEGHDVLGTMANVRKASSHDLYKFYKDNYIPENLAIIIYGKIDEKFVKKTIKKMFSDVPVGDSSKANQYINVNDETIISGKYIRKREMDPAQLAIIFKTQSVVVDDFNTFKTHYLDQLYVKLMDQRLTDNLGNSVEHLSVNKGSLISGNEMYNFRLTLADSTTYQLLFDNFCYSLAQVHEHGFSEKEIEYQKQLMLHYLGNRRYSESTMLAKAKAHFKNGDVPLTPEQFSQYANRVLQAVTPADLKNRFKRMMALHTTILYDSTATACSEAFNAMYIQDNLQHLDTITTQPFVFKKQFTGTSKRNVSPQVLMGERSVAKIQKEVQLDDNLRTLSYANGVKVVLYQSMDDEATIKLLTGVGLNKVPEQHRFFFEKSLGYLPRAYGSYGKKEARTLERSFSAIKRVAVEQERYELKIMGKSEYIEQMIKIFNLTLSDVKYPEHQVIIDRLTESVKRLRSKAGEETPTWLNDVVINEELITKCFQYHRMMTEDLHNAIVFIEGNLPDNIEELVSRYVGSLPSTKQKHVKQSRTDILVPNAITYKDSTWSRDIAKLSYVFKGVTDKSLTMRDELVLQGVLEHVHLKMMNVMRKKYGMIYASGKSMALTNGPGYERMLNIRFLTDTSNVQQAYQVMKDEVIATFAQATLSDIEVQEMKAMVRSLYVMSFYDDKRLSESWLNLYFKYGKVYSPKALDKMIKSISKHELQQCLNEVIDVDCYQRITIRP